MDVVVVYESLFGNTRLVAEAIADGSGPPIQPPACVATRATSRPASRQLKRRGLAWRASQKASPSRGRTARFARVSWTGPGRGEPLWPGTPVCPPAVPRRQLNPARGPAVQPQPGQGPGWQRGISCFPLDGPAAKSSRWPGPGGGRARGETARHRDDPVNILGHSDRGLYLARVIGLSGERHHAVVDRDRDPGWIEQQQGREDVCDFRGDLLVRAQEHLEQAVPG